MAAHANDELCSDAFRRLEWERLWTRTWLLAGAASDLRQTGDRFTFEVGAESILVTRDGDAVRAFYNVCPHRGRRLVDGGCGHARAMRCGYHGWTFRLDGSLAFVPSRETFAEPDLAERGLAPVACEVAGGLVWIHLAPSPPPLDAFLGPVRALLERYALETFDVREHKRVELACNWKVALDGANESYHAALVHPQNLGVLDEVNTTVEHFGDHAREIIPFGVPSPNAPDGQRVTPELAAFLAEAGLSPGAFEGRAGEARRAVQLALRARAAELGLTALDDDQLTDDHNFFLFPNVILNVFARTLIVVRHLPHRTDPERMVFDQMQLERRRPGATPPARPATATVRSGTGALGPVVEQDAVQFARVQESARSIAFRPPLLGGREDRIARMRRALARHLAEPESPR